MSKHSRRRTCVSRLGFSLVESLAAISITTIAGTALLTAATSAVQSTTESMRVAMAQGLAAQLLDETAAVRFPSSTSTRPTAGTPRAVFDELDDFSVYSAKPPVDRNGQWIGVESRSLAGQTVTRSAVLQGNATILARFTQEVQVERVQPNVAGDWTVATAETGYRRVTVRVKYTDSANGTKTVATATRIFSAVKMTP